jgi:mannose-6-phosphate isomerase-like protein (cupin superfamily)
MSATQKNYSVFDAGLFGDLCKKEVNGTAGRIMLGKALGLTGCEISLNSRPANVSTPFAHSHKLNEEVYIILKGSGMFYVDGDEFPVREGSAIRVAPGGKRVIKSGDEGMIFICIQAQNGSLTQATSEDGIRSEEKASWM